MRMFSPASFRRAEAPIWPPLSCSCVHSQASVRQLRSSPPGSVLPTECRQTFTPFSKLREPSMSIFGKIMSAIFGTKAAAAPGGGTAADTGSSTSTPAPGGTASSPAGSAPAPAVDVAAIVDKAAAAKGEKLEWRTSIVDLMKALDIDSSFAARKELAHELGYSGDSNDSASMNIWLHKQVMAKLAANGGKLPPEIKH